MYCWWAMLMENDCHKNYDLRIRDEPKIFDILAYQFICQVQFIGKKNIIFDLFFICILFRMWLYFYLSHKFDPIRFVCNLKTYRKLTCFSNFITFSNKTRFIDEKLKRNSWLRFFFSLFFLDFLFFFLLTFKFHEPFIWKQ